MSSFPLPLVSVGVPLYRSSRFLDILSSNLDALQEPELEILVSDRHGEDSALNVLEERYRRDPRLIFLRGSDRLSWVEHYNLLLRRARGKYFMWMPHDDSFPRDYVRVLVRALEQRPDAVLAYGYLELVSDDQLLARLPAGDPNECGSSWTRRQLVELLFRHEIGVPFRGVFRRDVILERKLWLRATRDTRWSDVYWVLAVGLCGRLYWTPLTGCQKRLAAASASADWQPRALHEFGSDARLLDAYFRALNLTRKESGHLIRMVLFWHQMRLGGRLWRQLRVPSSVYFGSRDAARSILRRLA